MSLSFTRCGFVLCSVWRCASDLACRVQDLSRSAVDSCVPSEFVFRLSAAAAHEPSLSRFLASYLLLLFHVFLLVPLQNKAWAFNGLARIVTFHSLAFSIVAPSLC